MVEFKLKDLNVKLNGSSIDAAYGDMVLKADVITVWDAVKSAAGVIGIQKCLNLGGAAAIVATSLYAVAKIVSKSYKWFQVTGIKENNILQVSVPKKHEDRFDKLVADGTLTRKLQNDFKNLDNTLLEILEEEVYEKVGKDVLKLIEKVRLESTSSQDSNSTIVGQLYEGKDESTIENHDSFYAANKGTRVVGKHVKKGAELKQTIRGGTDVVVAGIEGSDLRDLQENFFGDRIQLIIGGNELSEKFEDKFKATYTIEDVIKALKKKEEKTFRIFRGGKELDKNTTIAQVAQEGIMLTAKTESEITKTANPMEH